APVLVEHQRAVAVSRGGPTHGTLPPGRAASVEGTPGARADGARAGSLLDAVVLVVPPDRLALLDLVRGEGTIGLGDVVLVVRERGLALLDLVGGQRLGHGEAPGRWGPEAYRPGGAGVNR